uniref:GOLD domain-containing protein n=1 Tax=Gossypium raimondii TaxID=29730 RepID=A0A0D2TXW7_GOSRA|nr:hypothetical protein B456_013G089000 [Gossypium raimondii]
MILRSVLVLVLLVGVLFRASQSLRFDLQSGQTKCIAEDIKSNSMTVGKYHVVKPNEDHPLPDSHKLTVRVTSSYGNNFHSAEKVENGQFAFTATEQGDYMACFWAPEHSPPITVTVDFDWRTGVHTKDWTNVAKKGQVDVSIIIPSHEYVALGGGLAGEGTIIVASTIYIVELFFVTMVQFRVLVVLSVESYVDLL